jgi:hypothetical protein
MARMIRGEVTMKFTLDLDGEGLIESSTHVMRGGRLPTEEEAREIVIRVAEKMDELASRPWDEERGVHTDDERTDP